MVGTTPAFVNGNQARGQRKGLLSSYPVIGPPMSCRSPVVAAICNRTRTGESGRELQNWRLPLL